MKNNLVRHELSQHHKVRTGIRIFLITWIAMTPVLVIRNYLRERTLQKHESLLRQTLWPERKQLITQTVSRIMRQSSDARVMIRRELPCGPIQGLPPCPTLAQFKETLGCATDPGAPRQTKTLKRLQEPDRFLSGLPKRYAGLAETIIHPPRTLHPEDLETLHRVFCDFYRADSLGTSAFLLLRSLLPAGFQSLLATQARFLDPRGQVTNSGLQSILERDGQRLWVTYPAGTWQSLKETVSALDPGARLTLHSHWRAFGTAQVNVDLTSVSASDHRHLLWWSHLLTLLGLETCLLALLFTSLQSQRMDRMQRTFLAVSTHEMRTPLAVIRQFAELLTEREAIPLSKMRQIHQHILRECLRMEFLLENLLSKARMEHIRLRPSPSIFELKTWLAETLVPLQQLHSQPIEMDVSPMQVCWDRRLMERVLINLVDNARKHARTRILVTACALGDHVSLGVRDWCESTKPEDLEKKGPFRPGEQSSAGLGLGLYLARTIVRAHQGKINIQPANPGLLVEVILPIRVTRHS